MFLSRVRGVDGSSVGLLLLHLLGGVILKYVGTGLVA